MLENTRSGLGISCGGLAILSLSFVQTQTLPVPFAQWAYALPVVFVGVTFATAQKNMTRTLAFLAFIVIGSLAIDATNGLLELTIAGAAMMACGFFRLAPTLLSAWCGRMSLWIYLAHPAVMTMLVRGANIPEGSVVLAVLTAAVTLAIVAVAETLTSSRLLGNALNP